MKKAIVTLLLGDRFQQMFSEICAPGWTAYCEKWGYELVAIQEPMDPSQRAMDRSPAWQKLLILSQDWSSKYDQIVWVDADILINHELAPDICSVAPLEKVSAVDAYAIPNRASHAVALERLYRDWDRLGVTYLDNLSPASYYANRGISGAGTFDAVVQTGVFVCSPKHHRALFEHVYHSYEDTHGAEWNYEMPAMSFEIIKNDLHHWIAPQFNHCVADLVSAYYPFLFHISQPKSALARFVTAAAKAAGMPTSDGLQLAALENIYDLSYFMHFAGNTAPMQPLAEHLSKRDAGA